MIDILIKKFIKNYDDINSSKVRESYGLLSSIVGIICNIFLFIIKLIAGTISNSISITSDAFNNLTDCSTNILGLIGYKISNKPADKEHPFGHGRVEYILSFIISIAIFLVAYELIKSSITNLSSNTIVTFSYVSLVILLLSIFIKYWMYSFNNKLGKKLDSELMIAVSKDSISDIFATSATLVSMLINSFVSFPIDPIMGIIVSILILKTAYEILKSNIDKLLGIAPDNELIEKIKEIIVSDDLILGYHDLMIHSYGPNNSFGSVHVEFDSNTDFLKAHDVVDLIELKLKEEFGINMTLHMDPININDVRINKYHEKILNALSKINANISIHDLRLVSGDTHTNVVFDIVTPFKIELNEKDVLKYLKEEFKTEDTKLYYVFNIEHEYM